MITIPAARLKRDVVVLGWWRRFRFTGVARGWRCGPCAPTGRSRRRLISRRFVLEFCPGTPRCSNELEVFTHDLHLGFLLSRFLVLPAVQLEPSFHKDRLALGKILADRLRLSAPHFNIHESNILFLFSRVRRPAAVHRQARSEEHT